MHTRSNETIHKLKLYSTKVIVKSEIIFSPKLKKCQTRPIYAQQSKNYKHTTISSVDGRRGGLTCHDGWRERTRQIGSDTIQTRWAISTRNFLENTPIFSSFFENRKRKTSNSHLNTRFSQTPNPYSLSLIQV